MSPEVQAFESLCWITVLVLAFFAIDRESPTHHDPPPPRRKPGPPIWRED